tara:strand:- start:1813 stop:2397 length:585 start_codon:yes stop_codon:yes gene_type:complete
MAKRKIGLKDEPIERVRKKSRNEMFIDKMEQAFVINGYKKEDQYNIIEQLKSLSKEERIANIYQKVSDFMGKIGSNKILINSMINCLNFDLLQSYKKVKVLNQNLINENKRLIDLNNTLHEIYEKEKVNNLDLFTQSHEIVKGIDFPENFDIQDDSLDKNVIEFDFENLPFPECFNFNDEDLDKMFVNDELTVY